MTYDELIQETRNEEILRLSDAISMVEDLIVDQYDEYEDDYENSRQKRLRNIGDCFDDIAIQCIGDADDYHNLSVAYARNDMYDQACKVLNRGLMSMPFSVDLLADYIKYGLFCGKEKLCAEYYARLQEIPRDRWNWRAYSFSIDYLLDQLNRENDTEVLSNIKIDALSHANAFIKNIGVEQAYFDKSTVHRAFNEFDEEHTVLLTGFELLKVTPKCALRLAVIGFDKGDFENAIIYLKRCVGTPRPQPDIANSYAYLLLALGKTSILLGLDSDENGFTDDEKTVEGIYRDLHTAIDNGLSGVHKKTADATIKTLAAQTGIEYPYTDSDDQYDY